jgi:hypothetical protein
MKVNQISLLGILLLALLVSSTNTLAAQETPLSVKGNVVSKRIFLNRFTGAPSAHKLRIKAINLKRSR